MQALFRTSTVRCGLGGEVAAERRSGTLTRELSLMPGIQKEPAITGGL